MLRSGVSFPALMNLLGHSTPKMTLLYAEFTQTDLQREFRAAPTYSGLEDWYFKGLAKVAPIVPHEAKVLVRDQRKFIPRGGSR